jgi:hypothetical protein
MNRLPRDAKKAADSGGTRAGAACGRQSRGKVNEMTCRHDIYQTKFKF